MFTTLMKGITMLTFAKKAKTQCWPAGHPYKHTATEPYTWGHSSESDLHLISTTLNLQPHIFHTPADELLYTEICCFLQAWQLKWSVAPQLLQHRAAAAWHRTPNRPQERIRNDDRNYVKPLPAAAGFHEELRERKNPALLQISLAILKQMTSCCFCGVQHKNTFWTNKTRLD